MRVAILILAIVGSVVAFAVGACTGACMAGVGDAAQNLGAEGAAAEGAEAGAGFLMWALGQAILGLVGGIMAFSPRARVKMSAEAATTRSTAKVPGQNIDNMSF